MKNLLGLGASGLLVVLIFGIYFSLLKLALKLITRASAQANLFAAATMAAPNDKPAN